MGILNWFTKERNSSGAMIVTNILLSKETLKVILNQFMKRRAHLNVLIVTNLFVAKEI